MRVNLPSPPRICCPLVLAVQYTDGPDRYVHLITVISMNPVGPQTMICPSVVSLPADMCTGGPAGAAPPHQALSMDHGLQNQENTLPRVANLRAPRR